MKRALTTQDILDLKREMADRFGIPTVQCDIDTGRDRTEQIIGLGLLLAAAALLGAFCVLIS